MSPRHKANVSYKLNANILQIVIIQISDKKTSILISIEIVTQLCDYQRLHFT